jgi:hypothetical protein
MDGPLGSWHRALHFHWTGKGAFKASDICAIFSRHTARVLAQETAAASTRSTGRIVLSPDGLLFRNGQAAAFLRLRSETCSPHAIRAVLDLSLRLRGQIVCLRLCAG